jgi:hypothetical protein
MLSVRRRLRRLKPRDMILIRRAFAAVLHVRLYLFRRDHAGLRRVIDRNGVALRTDIPHADLAEVAWSVRAAARLVPGATCLTQASAGQMLLARRGYATIVRLSVPADGEGPGGAIAPHAWLMAGETIVLGGTAQDYSRHRPLHDFVLPNLRMQK